MADEQKPTEQEVPTNAIYRKIIDELKAGTDPKKRGAPIAMSPEMFSLLLEYLRNGLEREEAFRAVQLGKTTFYTYMSKSETFQNAVERAEDFPNVAAQITVVKDMTGRPSQKRKVLDRKGNLVEVEDPEVPGNVETAEWWLERVKKHKFSKMPIVAVQNNSLSIVTGEKQMAAAERLLRKYAKDLVDDARPTATE